MNSRERLNAALNHQEPDRVPIDLGGTPTSTISVRALENLKSYLGIRSATRLMSPIFLTAFPDDEVIKKLGIDVKMIAANPPAGFELRAMPEGELVDEWGTVYKKHEEAQTHFVVEEKAPLRQATLTEEIEAYSWPDPADPSRFQGLRETAEQFRAEGFGVVLNTPLLMMTQAQWVRGLEQFMMDTVLNQRLLEYLMDKLLEILLEMTRQLIDAVGPNFDVAVMGDDLSHQRGLTYSPDMYRRLFKPRHRKIADFLKGRIGKARILYHCCGAVEPLIRDLIEIGVDALNPVQVSATGMGDTRRLKELYGKDLTFWGGVDTQHVLPFGTPADVKEEARRRIEDLGAGGGFVFGAVHNLRPEVRPENIWALFEAAHFYGKYPLPFGS